MNCVYDNCTLKCRSIEHHRAKYAAQKNNLIHILSQKKQITKSSKINYEALNKFWFEIENKEKKSS
jgi:hypothetical protein